jgi:hypothetical protein
MEGSLFRHFATPLKLRLVVDHLDEDDAFPSPRRAAPSAPPAPGCFDTV